MNRLLVALVVLFGLLPGVTQGVEIKNIRPCYGLFGATRAKPGDVIKCQPGDVLFMTYDIEDLKLDKDGKASYDTTLELLDLNGDKEKIIFDKKTPNEVFPQLGGTRMPGDLHVIMGPKQAPGKYAVRLSVADKLAGVGKKFTYEFEVVPSSFGIIGLSAPAVGFPGQNYVTGFGLVNLGLKKKRPDAEVTIKILDEKGAVVGQEVRWDLPPLPAGVDLEDANYVPVTNPVYLNRAGRFTVEIRAHDKVSDKKVEIRYPLTVLDVNKIAAGN